jgi:hypothetical protein
MNVAPDPALYRGLLHVPVEGSSVSSRNPLKRWAAHEMSELGELDTRQGRGSSTA